MLRRPIAALAGAFVSVAAAHAENPVVAWVGAGLTALTIYSLSRRSVLASGDPATAMLEETTKGLAAYFAWAGLAMAGGYYLTAERWYHAYQYSVLLLLLAGVTGAIAWKCFHMPGTGKLKRCGAPGILLMLAVVQLLAALSAIIFLVSSGKLFMHRADWLANIIFASAALGAVFGSALVLPRLCSLVRSRA